MSKENHLKSRDECLSEGPHSTLERRFITEFLQEKGYKLEDLQKLPEQEAKKLMRGACQYASLKLAEVESRAIFREQIRGPTT
jgi:hypothetical protein